MKLKIILDFDGILFFQWIPNKIFLFFDSLPCKTMKMKLSIIGSSFESEKIVFKNQFFYTYIIKLFETFFGENVMNERRGKEPACTSSFRI